MKWEKPQFIAEWQGRLRDDWQAVEWALWRALHEKRYLEKYKLLDEIHGHLSAVGPQFVWEIHRSLDPEDKRAGKIYSAMCLGMELGRIRVTDGVHLEQLPGYQEALNTPGAMKGFETEARRELGALVARQYYAVRGDGGGTETQILIPPPGGDALELVGSATHL